MCIRSCKENSETANLAIVSFFSILILCAIFILCCVCWIYPFDLLSLSLKTFILMLLHLRAFTHNRCMTEEWSKNSVYFAAFSFVSFSLHHHGPSLGPVTLLCLEQGDRPLEDHTRDFLHLECLVLTTRIACSLYFTSPA